MHLPGLTGETGESTLDLAVATGGILVAGSFRQVGTVVANPARWDGEGWSALPRRTSHRIIVGGDGITYLAPDWLFCLECGSNEVLRLAGDEWVEASPGFWGQVSAFAATADGIVAVGELDSIAARPSTHVARLSAGEWVHLGRVGEGSTVLAVAVNGDRICVGGRFEEIEGVAARNVACLEGTNWAQAGDGIDGEVRSLAADGTGRLVAGGELTGGGHVLELLGRTWQSVGGGVGGAGAAVEVVAIDGSLVYVGGRFDTPAVNLARFNGVQWAAPPGVMVADSSDARVTDIVVDPSGDAYVAGRFSAIGEVPVARIVRWSPAGVSPLLDPGDVPLGIGGEVKALAVDADGALIAAGRFSTAGTARVANVARFTGTGWEPLGDPAGPLDALLRRTNGELVAGGPQGVLLRWQGDEWTGGPSLGGAIRALIEHEGDVIIGGDFLAPGAHAVRSDDGLFQAIGEGLPVPVRVFAISPEGSLCAGLDHGDPPPGTTVPVSCWNGSSWIPDPALRGSLVSGLAFLEDGRMLVAGSLWIDERPHRAAVRGPEGWQPVGRRDVTYIAREVVVLPLATGAILAITNDTVDWWDGADGYTAIASGVPRTEAWARALLATDDAVIVGGVGAWTSGAADGPLSSGLAIWDFD